VQPTTNQSTERWLAAHLYYAEPWDTFLVQQVKPFVERILQERWARRFFFIRYWERGPHIRLRFQGEPHRLYQEVKPRLESYFLGYFQQNPSQRTEPDWVAALPAQQCWFSNNSIQFIPYEPEVERYGGPTGIQIAEQQFALSSHTALDRMASSADWPYHRALGAAIQLHLGFAWALGMDLAETRQFYTYIFKSWLARACGISSEMAAAERQHRYEATLTAFAAQFEAQKERLVATHRTVWEALADDVEFEQTWLNDWRHGMEEIGRMLRAAHQCNALQIPPWFRPDPQVDVPPAQQQLWPILGSYVHMTNNRLGILNRDEAYLGYLIDQSLQHL